MRREDNGHARGRGGERGAALITALLVSMLLLAAGGALIYTTGMSATNAVDATAEVQAYYAAEAGLQSAASVVRGNVAKQGTLNLPAGLKVKNNLRALNDLTTSNLAADKSAEARLSGWLPYNNGRVSLGNNVSFALSITDPDDPTRVQLTANPNYNPARLLVTSTGYGPKGATKRMQMIIRPAANIDVPGAVTLRGAPSGGGMSFDLGNSNGRTYLTDDPTKPVFVTTNSTDETQVKDWIANDTKSKTQFGNPNTGNTALGTAKLPAFLQSPAAAEALIADLKAIATPDNNITIVEGNASIKDGSGIMVVTGNLDLGGNSTFNGILLVLGGGSVTWHGQGQVYGAMFVAKYDRNDLTKDFQSPSFNVNGAGKSTIQYVTTDVQNALGDLGIRIAGVVEN
ncbi:MAG: pilus assembly PilX N-terminal domain-containing protein [Acidobacteria bacterium]|nr:pilus assembly PilX N-terminal domain-containing protein [Acidobacteriota bacterium]